MKTIYLVVTSDYYGPHVQAVFDDEALAEEYIRIYDTSLEVEEWELNPEVPQIDKDLKGYSVQVSKEGKAGFPTMLTHRPLLQLFLEKEKAVYLTQSGNQDYMTAEVLAKSLQEAVEIAKQQHQLVLDADKWPARHGGSWRKVVL